MGSSQTSSEIVVRSNTDLAQVDELEKILLSDEAPVEALDDPETISREIVAQLLAAESDEQLQSFGTATGWRELLDLPVELRGFHWRRSDFADVEDSSGPPVYFVVQANDPSDGKALVLTTGSRNVLAMLVNMAKRGTMVGAVVKLVQSEKQTARGFRPLWLEIVKPAPVVSGNGASGSES